MMQHKKLADETHYNVILKGNHHIDNSEADKHPLSSFLLMLNSDSGCVSSLSACSSIAVISSETNMLQSG